MNLANYQTLVFDCDGVVLDSNRIKTEAFRLAALPWGEDVAEAFVAHHVANGGISRYAKFKYLMEELVPRYAETQAGPGPEEMLAVFAKHVRAGLETCDVAIGLQELRRCTANSRWMIVSGGDQSELREVFSKRGLDTLFDGGIHGSPDIKTEILEREKKSGNIRKPALFLGDSRYDHVAAAANGLDFLFISQWTELDDWESYCRTQDLRFLRAPSDLLVMQLGDDGG